ncbi:DUF1403 family protein [Pseudaminobacter sp. NGMCC 1.201702]|uniref:DUF1403 family protein n=1 Tax=Pseudaminobacter sp. NGMCC 1.201702 TaxID=3391825 RepID=UPI0039F0BE98
MARSIARGLAAATPCAGLSAAAAAGFRPCRGRLPCRRRLARARLFGARATGPGRRLVSAAGRRRSRSRRCDLARAARPAPFAAAAIASHVVARHPDAELLAWWGADLVVAQSLGWPRPLPLLMAQAFAPAFRAEGGHGKRLRPGEAGFERAVCLGLAQGAADACRLAGEIQRRAARLAVVAPKLRAKGAAAMIQKLSDDDAVPGALTTKTLSRFQMLSKTGPVFMDRLTCPGPKHRHSKV